MSASAMLAHMLLERLSWREQPRIPEPGLVMDDPAQVQAFAEMGREDGLLAPVYFFHALHMSLAIKPGDHVLDLACGPANQLATVAHMHPQAHFLGVDMSDHMLDLAGATLRRRAVRNVSLQREDICTLEGVADASIDCLTCTLSLHHLADEAALRRTMQAVRRVLKPGGGIYLADFGRLKRAATQHYFAHDREKEQAPLFTKDFLNSMKAAFSVEELQRCIALLGGDVMQYQTILAPFMVIFRRARVSSVNAETQALARALFNSLPSTYQHDLRALSAWFQAAGLQRPFSLKV